MDSLANGHVVDVRPVRLAIFQNLELNGEALATLFRDRHDFVTMWWGTSCASGVDACRGMQIDVLLLDATIQGESTLPMATNLLRDGFVRAAALLDNVVDPIRSAATADLPIAYFSRAVSFDTLCRGILQLAGGTPMSDTTPATMNGSGVTPGNPYRRESMISQLSRLTPRETEVMRLIATGNTVKDCAKILRLAQSTVDNHKTRLMKKLDVHKSSDLTRLAIRAGLIVA